MSPRGLAGTLRSPMRVTPARSNFTGRGASVSGRVLIAYLTALKRTVQNRVLQPVSRPTHCIRRFFRSEGRARQARYVMIEVPSAISCRRDGINYVGDGISWKVARFRSLGARISVLVASISGKEESSATSARRSARRWHGSDRLRCRSVGPDGTSNASSAREKRRSGILCAKRGEKIGGGRSRLRTIFSTA